MASQQQLPDEDLSRSKRHQTNQRKTQTMTKQDKDIAIEGLRNTITQETPIYTLVMKRTDTGSKWIKVFVAAGEPNNPIMDMTWNVAKAFGYRLKATDMLAILVEYEEDAYRSINNLLFNQSLPLPPHIKL